jgi:hypothetical protein
MHSYELHLYELALNPDCNTAGDIFMATVPEPTVPEPYRAYMQVFSEADSESVPSHGLQDLAIKHLNGKQSLWGPIYHMSKKELDTLYSYLMVQLKQGWIRLSKSPAGAQIQFVPKKDSILQLCVFSGS